MRRILELLAAIGADHIGCDGARIRTGRSNGRVIARRCAVCREAQAVVQILRPSCEHNAPGQRIRTRGGRCFMRGRSGRLSKRTEQALTPGIATGDRLRRSANNTRDVIARGQPQEPITREGWHIDIGNWRDNAARSSRPGPSGAVFRDQRARFAIRIERHMSVVLL